MQNGHDASMSPASTQLINGVVATALSPWDRAFLYGDGVFRTLCMRKGEPVWWVEHMTKLVADCQRLQLPVVPEALWRADLEQLAGQAQDAVIRLVVTRGQGDRGYRPPTTPTITRLAMMTPLPEDEPGLAEKGMTVRVCALRLGHQPCLAGIKHLNRLENVLARQEWDDPAIQEGLLFDQSDLLISGVQSNVFLLRDSQLLTPRLDACGVAGVTRARIMDRARSLGMTVVEKSLHKSDLDQAGAVFMCNSLMGLRWVSRLDHHVWHKPDLYAHLTEVLHG